MASNSKSVLQEFFQGRQMKLPAYKTEGFAERWTSTVTVHWSNGELLVERAEWTGKKKEAEQEAARKMLQRIKTLEGGGRGEVWNEGGGWAAPLNVVHHRIHLGGNFYTLTDPPPLVVE